MTRKILYRGFTDRFPDGVHQNIFIKNPRTPKDTNKIIHSIADQWFFDRFGIRARSQSIICSTEIQQATSYVKPEGTLAIIDPIGDFKIIFSTNIFDFIEYAAEGVTPDPQSVSDWLSSKYYQCKNNLTDISDHHGDVMLFCEKFKITNI